MTTYSFFANLTAAQVAPGSATGNLGVPANVPPGSQAIPMLGGAGSMAVPSTTQVVTVQVNGSGAVLATVQVWGSDDGQYWIPVGNPITATGAAGVGTASAVSTSFFAWFTAQLTTITGTGAVAGAGMNA